MKLKQRKEEGGRRSVQTLMIYAMWWTFIVIQIKYYTWKIYIYNHASNWPYKHNSIDMKYISSTKCSKFKSLSERA